MPCLNEAETIGTCIRKAQRFLHDHNIAGEIIVADNGSTDDSRNIAANLGARVVTIETEGYGSALMGGFAAARGKYIIMGDADDSYDFTSLDLFVDKLRNGYDLVMGNRFQGGIRPGAMPPLHKYLGNPVLTQVGRLFFRSPCRDFHCGLRGFSKEAIMKLDLRTTGMEFASEMVVKATLHKMQITEVPTILFPDGRSRSPHLRSWRDGWRHLRFLLIYSPRWLFLYPGTLLMLIGAGIALWLLPGSRTIGNITLDVHTMLYGAIFILVGFQAVNLAVFTKVFAVTEGLLPTDPKLRKLLRVISLEAGLLIGGILALIGLGGSVYAFSYWSLQSFGPLDPTKMLRIIAPASISLALGCQVILASFFLGVLQLKRRGQGQGETR